MKKILPVFAALLLLLSGIALAEPAPSVPAQTFSEDNRLLQEDYKDAEGHLYAGPEGYATRKLVYSDAGALTQEEFYDVNGDLIREVCVDDSDARVLCEDGWCEHTLTYDANRRKIAERWLGLDGAPTLYKDSYSGIDRAFDEAGNVIRETYYDAEGRVGPTANGTVTIVRQFDENKKATREAYLDANEALMLHPTNGYAVIERNYDADSRLVWYRYLDQNESPIAVKNIIELQQSYDEYGNVCQEILLDGNGNRTLHPDNWCEHRITYNENKQRIAERWLGVDGAPILYKDSYSGVDRAFDEAGNVIQETYYDAAGNVGPNANGTISVQRTFDENKKVTREAYLDAEGALMLHPTNGYAVIERKYDADSRLVWYRYLDENEIPIAVKGITEFEQSYDEYGNICQEIVLDGNGNRALHPDNWCEHQTVFNENKQKLSERWLGTDGSPILYKDSHSGVDREYDAAGNVTKETYYDAEGNVGATASGTVAVQRTFDENKKPLREAYVDAEGALMLHPSNGYAVIERKYDADSRLIWYRYLDASETPIAVKGITEFQQAYDEFGNVCQETVLDGQGNPALHPDNWSTHQIVYNENKQKLSERWLGPDGAPILFKESYSGIDRAFDEAGNVIQETYYDAEGNVGPNANGTISVQRTFDENKKATREAYLDAAGTLMIHPSTGYAVIERRYDEEARLVWYRYLDENQQPLALKNVTELQQAYDEFGNVCLEILLDGQGHRAMHPDNWCEHHITWNENKQKIAEHWLGIDGNPILYKNSYSGIDRAFDEAGNVVRETYYDAWGNVGANASGTVTVERVYDENKKVLREAYRDAAGALMLHPSTGYAVIERRYDEEARLVWYRHLDTAEVPLAVKGVAELQQAYDEFGNVCQEIVLDGHGNRTLHPDNWCEHQITFNENKQKVAERFLAVDGAPILYKESYSGIDRAFDEFGNVVRETYYDATGAVGPNASGVITVTRLYDADKHLLQTEYLNAEDQPMQVSGICKMVYAYDENGNRTTETAFDEAGARMLTPEGWSEHRTVYDDNKQKLSDRWVGVNDEPVLYKESYSGIDRAYDEAGNVIRETYYDADGHVGPNADGTIAVDRVFDDNKKAIREAWLDAEGALMLNASGYAVIERRYDEESRLVWYRYLDENQQPVAVKNVVELQQAYDDFGNVARETAFDGFGAPILRPEGWHEHTITYNDQKQKIAERWLGLNGEPVLQLGKPQYSGIDRAFDEAGNVIRETYYDAEGNVGPNSDGVIILERRFNENKQRIWYRYLDATSTPMALNGIAELQTAYDEYGNICLEIVLDGHGNRTLHPDNWCEHRITFNDKKQKTAERWLGPDGAPILYKDSYSGIDRAFDDAGNTIRETYYDITGNPGPNASGTVTVERVYDDNKKALRETYRDAEGTLMLHPTNGYAVIERRYDEESRLVWYRCLDENEAPVAVKGVAELQQAYDEFGNVCQEIVLDGHGTRTLRPEGWCEHTTLWNENKQKLSERWLGVAGEPVLQLDSVQYSGIDRAFDEFGNVVRETYYDADGNVGPNSAGVVTVTRLYDADKHLLSTEYLDAEGRPMQVSGICRMVYDYDENGNRIAETALDESGARMLTPEGWSQHRMVCDEKGQKLSDRWVGVNDEPVLYKDSYSGIDRAYDEAGNVIRETYYDAEGNVGPNAGGVVTVERRFNDSKKAVWVRYLDAQGLPMAVKGVFEMEQAYDDAGNLILERMLDGNGAKALRPEGWHEHRITCNDKNQKISERYLGLEGEPVLQLGNPQYSGIDRLFDDAGNVIRETYYDAEGNVGPNSRGVVILERQYDENKRVTWYRYLSAKEKPMAVDGVWEVRTGYDEAGNADRTTILDGSGQPALHPEGWHVHTTEYNDKKQKVAERYLGLAGEPVLLQAKLQYSGIDRAFDEAGNVIRETYYDAQGHVGANSDGVVTVTRVFDENKRMLSSRYLDAEDRPMMLESLGAAGENRAYDEAGNIIRQEMIGLDGALTLGAKGWAAAEYEYDEAKHKILEAYYDTNDNLLVIEGGYAKVTRVYDEDGNCISETYYNNLNRPADNAKGVTTVNRVFDGNKTAIYVEYRNADSDLRIDATEGHAAVTRELDAEGRVVRESYFGTDGAPMVSRKKNCASVLRAYDEAGNVISVSYFDAEGNPKIVDGKHCIVRHYDQAGNVVFEQFYNILGELMTTSEKYATVTRVYDDQKRVLEVRYFDAQGNPVLCKSGYATMLLSYEEGKNPVSRSYFDAEGARMEVNGAHQIIYAYSPTGKTLTESYFDVNGNRTNNTSGYSVIRYTYDENDKVADTAYFDKSGEQIVTKKGYASVETVRDERGNVIREVYYDENGKIKENKNYYAIIVKTYNEKNKVLTQEYRNAKDEPVKVRNLGYARVEYTYDDNGNKLTESYYSTAGNLVRPKSRRSAAVKTWTYDDQNRLVSERYYDADMNLFANTSNYAGLDNWYSEDGTVVETTYVNEHGLTIDGWITAGYCKVRKTYADDTRKLLLRQEYLNLDNEPMRGRPGYICTIEYEYDDFGRKIRESYYNEKGELDRGTRKYAVIEYSFDENGKTVTHYYREDGSLFK